MKDDDIWATIPEGVKHLLDALSVGTMLGTLFQMLPNIAAILTIIWTVIRILETDTVQRLLGRSNASETIDRGSTPRSD
jgi:ABC-type dipeptide/oligopeptide/nickel transport system permease component